MLGAGPVVGCHVLGGPVHVDGWVRCWVVNSCCVVIGCGHVAGWVVMCEGYCDWWSGA